MPRLPSFLRNETEITDAINEVLDNSDSEGEFELSEDEYVPDDSGRLCLQYLRIENLNSFLSQIHFFYNTDIMIANRVR